VIYPASNKIPPSANRRIVGGGAVCPKQMPVSISAIPI